MLGEPPLIVETGKLSKPKYGLLALPDTGLVGTIAVGHMISSKKMNEVGYVRLSALPPMLVIHNGEPKSPVRLYGNDDFVVLISETPLPFETYKELAKQTVQWAREKGIELLISLSGIAVQNREEIDRPQVFGIGASAEVRTLLKSRGFPLLEEGFIAGPQALILDECIEKTFPLAILLAQSYSKFPDPVAAVSILQDLNQAFGLDVDVKALQQQGEEFRIRLRELMQRTQQSMHGTKSHEDELPALYG
jgi:uncharacterized protein (TIGR00161 family)